MDGRDDERQVLDAAQRRAQALADADADALRALLHPALRWTTFRGEVLTRDQYLGNNVGGALVWRAQHLTDPAVVVVGQTAVLIARVVDEIQRNGVDQTFIFRLTQTWVRLDGSWCCLAGHVGPAVA